MNITIKTLGFNAKPDLKDFAHDKAGKLSRFYDEIIECEVSFSIDKSSTKENKVCDIKLSIPGNDLLATAQCKTFEEATAQCVDALQRQIEKRKTKLMTH
ncbi:ribosome-associated translation inhibitor RaiA [Ginsengibacter hankyongi]|uniref:Ribosome-associated translation inhibitor RaiA n=1 Tax=Ginsengibacter hankyongi TaxID=2607284 RepID=A0A5J5IHR0_9BACT|nr:ribosome-associated translation inhibitor RaiA [Ginsengibacter hankyongi]KAA9040625.1 ribosome-associated translation inhibitor RaiA [Ginsengibacter hankyongi]